MGRYLNSSTSYVLYKGQTEQPYFVDKLFVISQNVHDMIILASKD